jgi:hypothetical protein
MTCKSINLVILWHTIVCRLDLYSLSSIYLFLQKKRAELFVLVAKKKPANSPLPLPKIIRSVVTQNPINNEVVP